MGSEMCRWPVRWIAAKRVRRFCCLMVLCAGLAVPAGTGLARAQFAVCNQTLDVLNLAVSREIDGQFTTEGWWTIGANRCVDVIKEELVNRYIYVYAIDVFGQPILTGDFIGSSMCVGPKRFQIVGTEACWERGFQRARFMEVDTQAMARWTLFLKEPESG